MKIPSHAVSLDPVGEVTAREKSMGVLGVKRGVGSLGLEDITQRDHGGRGVQRAQGERY